MTKGRDHIWQRGSQFYLKLAIPRPMQHLFLSSNGKPKSKIVEPLGDSPSEAKDEARYRVARYVDVFKQIKAGLLTTPEQVAKAMRDGPGEPDITLHPNFEAALRSYLAGPPGPRELAQWRRRNEQIASWFERWGNENASGVSGEQPARPSAPVATATSVWTISEASEDWFKALAEGKSKRDATIADYRHRVQKLIAVVGDLPITEVSVVMASDFLGGLNVENRTRNNYSQTLKRMFSHAAKRGRFSRAPEDNPFADQRTKDVEDSDRRPFTVDELQTLFGALPPREVAPKEYSAATALPWVTVIALYTGARLEEIADLKVTDVHDAPGNGAMVKVLDFNERTRKLKNKSAVRTVPVHSELVRLGLLEYVAALPKNGPLFPGLTRRRDGKVGKRLSELFSDKLASVRLNGGTGLCFHAIRNTVSNRLDVAEARQSDVARILGHTVTGITFGTYSKEGPGLKVAAGVVEQIQYDGLRL